MPEPSQNKLVKEKFQKKVTDPYGKCEPVNIKPRAKRHRAGALRPYAAQPCSVCQSKGYLILRCLHPGPASFLSLPTGIPQSPGRHLWRQRHPQKGTTQGDLFLPRLSFWGGPDQSHRLGGSLQTAKNIHLHCFSTDSWDSH